MKIQGCEPTAKEMYSKQSLPQRAVDAEKLRQKYEGQKYQTLFAHATFGTDQA